MAITLKIGVGHLLPEFLANTFVFLSPFQATGAVAAGALQTFLDHLDHFLVVVQTYSHEITSFRIHYTIGEGNVKNGEIKKKRPSFRMTSLWWARRDLNPHVRNEH